MIVALPLLLALTLILARLVGEHLGWYYHAAILVALGGGLGGLFRLATPKAPKPIPKLPPTDDPAGRKLREVLEKGRQDLSQIDSALRRDSLIVPILLFAPGAALLCILQQRSYSPSYSLWFRLGFIPSLFYVFVRYIFPKTYRKRV